MLNIELWMILIPLSIVILVSYFLFYKFRLEDNLNALTEKHEVSKPHNDLNVLREFVENCWSNGYSIPEVKSILLEKGWKEEVIDKVFDESKVPNNKDNSKVNKSKKSSGKEDKKNKVKTKDEPKDSEGNIFEEDDKGNKYEESDNVKELKKEVLED